jgi:mono/diheme cytochrome c family protein
MTAFSAIIKSMLTRRFVLVAGLLMLASVTASACAVQESNTYPVETFSEMHYSQSFRMQEPPRLAPLADSVAFVSAGDASQVLNVPDKRERDYDPAVASNLYRVNCSVCHGVSGLGDGNAARHITSANSFYATTQGTPYSAPPNLVDSAATRLTERDTMVVFVTSGAVVMPPFGKLLPEEDIRDIVNYIFDKETGLSK